MLGKVTTGQGKNFKTLIIQKNQRLLFFCFFYECLYVVFKNFDICTIRFEREDGM